MERTLFKIFDWLKYLRNKKIDSLLVGLSLGHAFNDWYAGTLYIVLPYIAKDLGLTYSQVGILMGWNSFTSFFVNMPGGFIVDTVGKTRLLLGMSLALTGLPYFILGFSSSYVMAIVVVTFVGIGTNLWHPAAMSFLVKRYPENKGYAMAIHIMGGNLGNSLAPLAVGVTLTFLTWRKVLILNYLPGVLMGLILWLLLAKAGSVITESRGNTLSLKEYWGSVKTMFQNRNILLLCSVAGIRSMTSEGLLTFLPIYLVYDLKYSPALVGIYLTVMRVAGICASPFTGTVSDKKGRRPILTRGLLISSLLLITLVTFRWNYLFIAVLAILGFFLFSLQPVMLAWMMDLAPPNIGGTTISSLFGIQSLFAGLAPPVCGFIADHFGLLYSFYFLALTIFAANFLAYFIPEKRRQEEAVKQPGW
jgi:MFS family permease